MNEPLLLKEGSGGKLSRQTIIAIIITAFVVWGAMYLWHESTIRALRVSSNQLNGLAQVSDSYGGLLGAKGAGKENGAAPKEVVDALKNADYYPVLYNKGTQVRLTNGMYAFPAAGESSKEGYALKLEEETIVYGDLNGDGAEDAAAVLKETHGGSNVFYGLAAVMNWKGELKNVSTAFIGDRVVVKSLKIKDGTILVDVLSHRSDNYACCPTLPMTLRFALNDYGLEEL